jgi:Phytanoyl-CoA dioxygenase (PhyH)
MAAQDQVFPYRIDRWDDHDRACVNMPDSPVADAMRRLLDQVAIRGDELEMLALKAVDVAYWRNLNPQLEVSQQETAYPSETIDILPGQLSKALEHLAAHGYFRLPQTYPSELIARMCTCIYTVRSAGWPPVFAYLYDEFWALFQNKAIVEFIRSYLGEYKVTANIWAHYVEPRAWGAGWPPHVDSGNDGGMTIWVPLTDASVDNGCMYVVPQDLLPQTLPKNYVDWPSPDREELAALLHGVRPLPAKAGSLLGWNHQLVHWGGRATGAATNPRISLAIEFLSETITPRNTDLPITNPEIVPDFTSRLGLIAKAIIKYQQFEGLMRRYDLLAKRLIEWSEQRAVAR